MAEKAKASGDGGSPPRKQTVIDEQRLRRFVRENKNAQAVYAGVHKLVDSLDMPVRRASEDARGRKLWPAEDVVCAFKYLYQRHLHVDTTLDADDRGARKPRWLADGPDAVPALKCLNTTMLAKRIDAVDEIIDALKEYEGVPYERAPIRFRDENGAVIGPITRCRDETANAEQGLIDRLALRLDHLMAMFQRLERLLSGEVEPDKPAKEKQPPTKKMFKAYYLVRVDRKKEEEAARELLIDHGGKLPHQGTVSRWVTQVEKWLGTGNELPKRSSVFGPASSMDPSILDRGQPLDGRTPRQREKPSDDDDRG